MCGHVWPLRDSVSGVRTKCTHYTLLTQSSSPLRGQSQKHGLRPRPRSWSARCGHPFGTVGKSHGRRWTTLRVAALSAHSFSPLAHTSRWQRTYSCLQAIERNCQAKPEHAAASREGAGFRRAFSRSRRPKPRQRRGEAVAPAPVGVPEGQGVSRRRSASGPQPLRFAGAFFCPLRGPKAVRAGGHKAAASSF